MQSMTSSARKRDQMERERRERDAPGPLVNDIDEALRLFLKASELDDNFSSAHGMAAFCYTRKPKRRFDLGITIANQVCDRSTGCIVERWMRGDLNAITYLTGAIGAVI